MLSLPYRGSKLTLVSTRNANTVTIDCVLEALRASLCSWPTYTIQLNLAWKVPVFHTTYPARVSAGLVHHAWSDPWVRRDGCGLAVIVLHRNGVTFHYLKYALWPWLGYTQRKEPLSVNSLRLIENAKYLIYELIIWSYGNYRSYECGHAGPHGLLIFWKIAKKCDFRKWMLWSLNQCMSRPLAN